MQRRARSSQSNSLFMSCCSRIIIYTSCIIRDCTCIMIISCQYIYILEIVHNILYVNANQVETRK